MKKLTLIAALLLSLAASAQTVVSDTLSRRIYFRLGHRYVDSSYMGNRDSLDSLAASLTAALEDSSLVSVEIMTSASPDGSMRANSRLSRARVDSLAAYISRNYAIPMSKIGKRSGGVAWEQLRVAVAASDASYRDDVLDILKMPIYVWDSSGKIVDGRKKRLMEHNYGRTWWDMMNRFFPELRSGLGVIIFRSQPAPVAPVILSDSPLTLSDSEGSPSTPAHPELEKSHPEPTPSHPEPTPSHPELVSGSAAADRHSALDAEPATTSLDSIGTATPDTLGLTGSAAIDTVGLAAADSVIIDALRRSAESDSLSRHSELVSESQDTIPGRPLFALKTNLLYDLALTPNVEIEWPFAKGRFSIMGEYTFPWWTTRNNANCFQAIFGGIEPRLWFGNRDKRPMLTGHFVGIYGDVGKFDVEWKGTGYQCDLFWSAGATYGYALALNRSLRLEFSLGVGYFSAPYRHYLGVEDHTILALQYYGKYSWFGPTKAKVSLVWLIHSKDRVRKGGAK